MPPRRLTAVRTNVSLTLAAMTLGGIKLSHKTLRGCEQFGYKCKGRVEIPIFIALCLLLDPPTFLQLLECLAHRIGRYSCPACNVRGVHLCHSISLNRQFFH